MAITFHYIISSIFHTKYSNNLILFSIYYDKYITNENVDIYMTIYLLYISVMLLVNSYTCAYYLSYVCWRFDDDGD